MNIFTFLLCILVNEVKSQSSDIVPAKILASQNTLSENSDLHVTCSTFGSKKHSRVFVYLCNNGIGVRKQIQKVDDIDTAFTISKVTPKNSGNYSCVYSPKEHEPSTVNATGNNIIEIRVIENFAPAHLLVSGASTVSHGAQIELLCSLTHVLQTLRDCVIVQSYLMQDGVIYQVQGFDVERMEARFVVQDAVQRDSGRYSCVVRPSQCFGEDEERLTGNNVVVLQVKEAFPLGLTLFSIAAVMLLLGIGLWTIYRRDEAISCAKCPQTNDNAIELQRHTESEWQPSDEQGESFDEPVDLGYQNVETDTDQNYDNLIPVYDELPSQGSSYESTSDPLYATCSKSNNVV